MELILLSVFGTALLIVLELCGLFYERWLREPYLTGSDPPAAPSANQPRGTGIAVHGHPRAGGPISWRWVFVDRAPTERVLHCSDAANDAGVTTIRRFREQE